MPKYCLQKFSKDIATCRGVKITAVSRKVCVPGLPGAGVTCEVPKGGQGAVRYKIVVCVPTKGMTLCGMPQLVRHELTHARQFADKFCKGIPLGTRKSTEKEAYTRSCERGADMECISGAQRAQSINTCVNNSMGFSTGKGNVDLFNRACANLRKAF